MPRVALTKEQKERNAVADVCKSMLDGLNMKRERRRNIILISVVIVIMVGGTCVINTLFPPVWI